MEMGKEKMEETKIDTEGFDIKERRKLKQQMKVEVRAREDFF